MPVISTSSNPRTPPRQPQISESGYPIYWVEVLDAAHLKWQPVDPFSPRTLFRANKLEPPASDRGNCLSYVISFEEDGTAKDVTRRYAKAINAKTRRMRIDGPILSDEGKRWWRRALKRYRPSGLISDLDQIENNELNGMEAREPLPRNVIDFKNHPIYALQRHLRRHEVLVPGATVVGTVGAGSKGPLEKIYRRKDVKVARSADKWYRMGREIKLGEEPVKVLPRRKRPQRRGRLAFDEEYESSDDDPVLGPSPAKGVPIFTFDQTQLYVPPSVVAGRVPKNKFNNIDAHVPSMIPSGGAHIVHPRAGRAAHLLGIDYAPALTGFDWKGRKGTAVYSGVVVPAEAEEGVRAVIRGFEDLERMLEEERRSLRALATWKRLLRGLRIRKSVFADEDIFDADMEDSYVPVDEDGGVEEVDSGREAGGSEPDNDLPGGFEPGGFEAGGFEPGDFEPGGFEPSDFEPGGFEPGGFEPGGFEITVSDKGKGPETRDYDHAYEPEVAGSVRRQRVKRARVLESDEEIEDEQRATATLIDAGQPDVSGIYHDGSTPEPSGLNRDEEVQSQPMDEISGTVGNLADNVLQADAQPGGFVPVPDPVLSDEELGQLKIPPSKSSGRPITGHKDPEDGQGNGSETQHRGVEDESEDAELEDAESDVTEELYMDEDGSLVE